MEQQMRVRLSRFDLLVIVCVALLVAAIVLFVVAMAHAGELQQSSLTRSWPTYIHRDAGGGYMVQPVGREQSYLNRQPNYSGFVGRAVGERGVTVYDRGPGDNWQVQEIGRDE